MADEFYRSKEWVAIKRRVYDKYGRRCMRCGRTPKDGAVMSVDHILSRKLYPRKELQFSNLQVLCLSPCNTSKGWKGKTDYRPHHILWRISSHFLNYLLAAAIWWWLVKTIYINWPAY